MKEIIVKISIPKTEYQNWIDFEEDGLKAVKDNLKSDLTKACKDLGIKSFEIEVS